jgi:hypothetical protein
MSKMLNNNGLLNWYRSFLSLFFIFILFLLFVLLYLDIQPSKILLPHGMGDLYAAQTVGVGFYSSPDEGAESHALFPGI